MPKRAKHSPKRLREPSRPLGLTERYIQWTNQIPRRFAHDLGKRYFKELQDLQALIREADNSMQRAVERDMLLADRVKRLERKSLADNITILNLCAKLTAIRTLKQTKKGN